MVKLKRIDGKMYKQVSHHKNKKLAEAKGQSIRRKRNYSVRVVKCKKGYDVYVQLQSILKEQYKKYPMGYP
jgi:hypothetical protein